MIFSLAPGALSQSSEPFMEVWISFINPRLVLVHLVLLALTFPCVYDVK